MRVLDRLRALLRSWFHGPRLDVELDEELIGLVAAVALGGAMKGLLFGVAPRDAASLTVAPVLLALVALAASYLPARRAAAVDPATTLCSE